MASISKRRREGTRPRIKSLGDHEEFLNRITKSLYYGNLPSLPCLSLPVTEISAAVFSGWQVGRSVRRLHVDAAARLARGACVSPCALVMALLYLERLRACNPHYLAAAHPADLFLVSLMVSTKFLHDNGEEEEVFCDEWAASGGVDLPALNQLELAFLDAIEWRVYVSEASFERGLARLERRVALEQARLRGYFTYADLCHCADYAALADVARTFSAVCLSATLAYLSSLVTLLTSTLIISHCMPALHQANNLELSTVADVITTNSNVGIASTSYNKSAVEDRLHCCSDWQDVDTIEVRHFNWYDKLSFANFDDSYESWWSGTSVMNWLYQSSVITPVQRWLDKSEEIVKLISGSVSGLAEVGSVEDDSCYAMKRHIDRKCRWGDVTKLGYMSVAMSDR